MSRPAHDAADWDAHMLDSLHDPYSPFPSGPYSASASPAPAARMLKSSRLSPAASEPELCISTSQVFNDFNTVMASPSPELASVALPEEPKLTLTVSSVPSKRPAASPAAVAKKIRGERVTTKEFIPPDVSGLSKREARLVKNRAAAFLSRQRKREEFETMEIRVLELEQENARLLALTQDAPAKDTDDDSLLSEVEQLRNQLAAMQRREKELAEQLSQKAAAQTPPVKMESAEPQLPAPVRTASMQHQHKGSGASLGLMVLLCALPTLLSMPRVSTAVPSTFNFPLPSASAVQSSLFDMQGLIPGDYDWLAGASALGAPSVMDVDFDLDEHGRATLAPLPGSPSAARKLEFVDADAEALGISGLDISFDALPAENGKIRVRIHPPAADAPAPLEDDLGMDLGASLSRKNSVTLPVKRESEQDAELGPFLGVGGDWDAGLLGDGADALGLASPRSGIFPSLFEAAGSPFDFEGSVSSGFSREGSPTSSRRRVRIALRSMPGEGREGGEWEVEVC